MKGLIYKDLLMTRKYCRIYLLIGLGFLAMGALGETGMFILAYPMMMFAMIPVTLISYDGHSRWESYSGTLPYSRGQLVSVKYIIGLLGMGAVLMLTALVQGIRLSLQGSFFLPEFLGLMSALLAAGCLPAAICLPLIFRLGYEKGRMAYMVTIGIFCGLVVGLGGEIGSMNNLPMLLLAPAALAVYGLSWLLSIRIYQNREL